MEIPSFPIVAIGSSAGGLEACSQLLSHLPAEPGMAFVFVQHLNPAQESHLTEIFGRVTAMPVMEARHGLEVRPNCVYVMLPNTDLTIAKCRLNVAKRTDFLRPHLPIDTFFRSLAQDADSRAVGVVLSGSGSDGALGLCEIKAAGGVTLVQDEMTAGHTGMPISAVQSGCADFVLPPAELARRLLNLHGSTPRQSVMQEGELSEALGYVRSITGVDFSQYRDTTIKRRIQRRALLLGQKSVNDYVGLLKHDGAEAQALYRDLLINVTSFFRDPDLFEALKTEVFPRILEHKSTGEAVRIWVPGCSTGEEAYSIAMALQECLDDRLEVPAVRIFATDLSGDITLVRARAGLYPESIESAVSPERLRRFFRKENASYRIDKSIRDMCVFAQQNITADPPFSRVDLISCRNVMIYMAPALQRQVLPMFHYALNMPGFLVLGTSETVGPLIESFELVDRVWKIYAKKPVARADTGLLRSLPLKPPGIRGNAGATVTSQDFQKEADRVLLGRFAPPGVLVNENFDILQFRGDTSDFLGLPTGEPTMSLLKMVRKDLFMSLRSALAEAQSSGGTSMRPNVSMELRGAKRQVDLEVSPIGVTGARERCFLVLFREPGKQGAGGDSPGWHALTSRFAEALSAGLRQSSPRQAQSALDQVRQELDITKQYMQDLTERQDATNEELRSANEEVMSSNEELQSTNEEMETAKEELQSANEELTTVNEQLHHRNAELRQANNDFANLLSSTEMPLVVVGGDLCIRLFTPPASRVMNLLPTDVGRPIANIRPDIVIDNLEERIVSVLETRRPVQKEVRDRKGRLHSLCIYPYRTDEEHIDGAVIVLMDIDDLSRALAESNMLQIAGRRKDEFLAMLGHELRNPLAPMSNALHIMSMPDAKPEHIDMMRGVMKRQLAQMTRIVEDLLDVTRIAQGKIMLRRERVDLVALGRTTVESVRPTIEKEFAHSVEFEGPDEAMYVNGDPMRLTQVIVNLLNNAAKFTDRNGKLRVSVCIDARDASRALISVRDNGMGISPDFLPQVFDLFVQGDTPENRRGGGLGIGLSLVRSLIELHGGTVSVHSDGHGKGCEFSIRLPLDATLPVPQPGHRHVATGPDNSLRILVVEDNADQAYTLSALLTLWGHTTEMALDGNSGLAKAREFRPDVALIDLGLPGMSGYDIARSIKADERLRGTYLIAQTGWGQPEDRVRAMAAGFDEHLVKPLDSDELDKLLVQVAQSHERPKQVGGQAS